MSFWIRTTEKPQTTHFYYFTKTIDIDACPAEISGASLKICADSRYRLYLNGKFVGEGPCQGSEYSRYYETYGAGELVPLLKKGKNELLVKVLWLQEGSFISIYRSSRPMLWIDGEICFCAKQGCGADNASEGKATFGTDGSWVCQRDDNVTFRHFPRIHTSTPPGEEQWGEPRLTQVELEQQKAPERGGYNLFGLADVYPLEPRPIPNLDYEEPRIFSIVRRGDGYIELDAGKYTTAIPTVKAAGAPGSVIKIIYSESYLQKDAGGNRYKGLRDAAYTDPEAEFYGDVFDVVHIPDSGIACFTPFWYRAFRFVRLEFTDPSVNFTELTYQSYFYPFPAEGSFECSDPALGEMWKVSINTVKCCAHEMYIDCPYYEQQQYDMDSCLELMFTQRMISDPRLPFKSVNDMARSQIFNGMLQANYPSVMTQIIPGFTMFWVIMFREYLRCAPADETTLKNASSLLGTMDKALESFEIFRDSSGLVGPNPYWNFVDWVPGWYAGITPGGVEGEPLTVESMLFVAALRSAAQIAMACGRTARAAEYKERAEELSALIVEKCYDDDAKLFRNTPVRREFSEHTSVWAVLSGIVTGEAAKELMIRTMDGDTPVAHCSFSMGSFLFRALEKAGVYDRYARRSFAGWQRMLDYHCTTWCENPDSPRSECHGWSSAPAYEFSAMILGAFPEEDGYKTLRVRPHLWALDTDWARGNVPTPFGPVNIDVRRSGRSSDNGQDELRRFSITVKLPRGKTFTKDDCVDGDEFRFSLKGLN